MKTIEQIFVGGKHTDAFNQTYEYDDEILKEIVENYDTKEHEAPVAWGHSGEPRDSLPAAGWIKRILLKGKKLLAEIDWSRAGENAVRNKDYRKFSAAFYRPTSPHNPRPGKWTLRHVALLGAEPPAVKGMDLISFSSGEILGVDFVEMGHQDKLRYNPFARDYGLKGENELKYDEKKCLYYYTENRKRNYVMDFLGRDGVKMSYDSDSGGYQPVDYHDYYVSKDGGRYAYRDGVTSEEKMIDQFFDSQRNPYFYDPEASQYFTIQSNQRVYLDQNLDEIYPAYSEGSVEPSQMTQFSRMDNILQKMESEKPSSEVLLMIEKLSERLQQMEAENEELKLAAKMASRELRHKELMDFLNGIYSSGKLTEGIIPKQLLASYMENLESGNFVEFSEKNESPTHVIRTLLSKLPTIVNFKDTQKEFGDDSFFSESNLLDPDKQAKELVRSGKQPNYESAIKYILYGEVN